MPLQSINQLGYTNPLFVTNNATQVQSFQNDQILCLYHGSARGCNHGIHCKYSHKNPNSIQLCHAYSSPNGCRYGPNCKFRHTNYDCNSSNCYQIKRMISALIFYSTIDPLNNPKHASKLVEYCQEIYPELLDDYIHIMDKHQNMHGISNTIKQDLSLVNDCNISNCQLLRRHFIFVIKMCDVTD